MGNAQQAGQPSKAFFRDLDLSLRPPRLKRALAGCGPSSHCPPFQSSASPAIACGSCCCGASARLSTLLPMQAQGTTAILAQQQRCAGGCWGARAVKHAPGSPPMFPPQHECRPKHHVGLPGVTQAEPRPGTEPGVAVQEAPAARERHCGPGSCKGTSQGNRTAHV